MTGLVFRMDGGNAVPVGGRPEDAGPGSVTVIDLDADANTHSVALALKTCCLSGVHLNASDERQVISWQTLKAAMDSGVHAVASRR